MIVRRLGLILFGLLIILFVFVAYGWLYFFDHEWQNLRVYTLIRKNHQQLVAYKQVTGHYPESLGQADVAERVCFLKKCFFIRYQVSEDHMNYRVVAVVNNSLVVYLDTTCPADPEALEENMGFQCGGLAYLGDNQRNEADFSIYRQDQLVFPTPGDWPELP